jgi:hypothetical protein
VCRYIIEPIPPGPYPRVAQGGEGRHRRVIAYNDGRN